MANTQTAPQLDPSFDYAHLPDGSYAKFKKGTSSEQMRATLMSKGLLKPPTQPTKPAASATAPRQPSFLKSAVQYPIEVGKGLGRAATGIGGYLAQAPQLRPSEEKTPWYQPSAYTAGPVGRFIGHSYQDLMKQLDIAAGAEAQARQQGETWQGQLLATAEKEPIIGPAVRYAELHSGVKVDPKTGKVTVEHFTPGQVGAATEIAAYKYAPQVIDKVGGKVLQQVTPKSLRLRAALLDTAAAQVLKEGSGSLAEKTADGFAMANMGIKGSFEKVSREVTAGRVATHAEYLKEAKANTTRGITYDLSNVYKSIINEIKDIRSRKGTLDAKDIKDLDILKNQLEYRMMPNGTRALRDWSKLTDQDIVDLTSDEKGQHGLLTEDAEFQKVRPDVINNAARRIRGEVLDKQTPKMQQLRADEASLIRIRESVNKQWDEILKGKIALGRAALYRGWGPLGLYMILRSTGLGGFAVPFIGTVIIYQRMASMASRTTRAAAYAGLARIGESIENAIRGKYAIAPPKAPPTAPTAPAGGPRVPPPPQGPTSPMAAPPRPQVAAQQGVIGAAPSGTLWQPQAGAPAPVASSAPTTAAADVSMIEFDRFRTGKASAEEFRAALKHQFPSVADAQLDDLVETAKRVKATQSSVVAPPGGLLPQNPTAGVDEATPTESQLFMRQFFTSKPTKDVGAAAQGEKSVAQRNTLSPEQRKAMQDRLGTIIDRQQDPKENPMNKAALKKERADIEKLLANKTSPESAVVGGRKRTEAGVINRKIQQREASAAKSAEAAAKQPAAGTPPPGGVTPAMDPEQRVTQLDLGYKALAKFDGGPEMSRALQKVAKELRTVDPNYDELEQLKQSLKVLIDAGERPTGGVQ
jgi:hypothetical protein